MTKRVTLTIPGEPVGWGRPTPVAQLRADGTAFVMMVTQEQTRQVKQAVRDAFRLKYPSHRPWTGPVLLRFTAVFAIPASFNRALQEAARRGTLYCVKKPDKDNIEKLIKDALNGLVYADDQQVMGGGLKRYGHPARVEISFESLESPDVPATPGQKRAERAQQRPLPLPAPRPVRSNPTNALSIPNRDTAPDLSAYNPRQRDLIQRALDRDKAARRGK